MSVTPDTLLFIDVTTPRAYDPESIKIPGGVGGTEMTVVQVAEALGTLSHLNVVVEEHNRFEDETFYGKATYASLGSSKEARWVVVLRDPRAMLSARKRFPNAKIYLWSHDLADRNLGLCQNAGIFQESGCLANVCVSDWHRNQTIETLKPYGYTGQYRMRYIYNPLSEDAVYTNEPYDKNKLTWLASPHKGLNQAYAIFKQLLRLNKEFRLYVTNPGYMESQYTDDPAIKDRTVVLGTIPHNEALTHLRNSLCLFYPNCVFPETFGKILAEANAVGTPVITSPLGAAREVLDAHPAQLTDCRNVESVAKRIMAWHSGERPIVRGNPKFKIGSVSQDWLRLFKDVR